MYSFVRRLVSSFLPYKLQSAFLLAAVAVELAFETFMPLSFKFIIDYAIVPKRYSMLLTLLFLMVGSAIASVAIGFCRDRIFADLGARILSDDYKRLFNKLQTLGTDFFHRTPGGDIVSRFTMDLNSIDAFVKLIPYTLLSVLGLAANVAVLFFLQWKLALLAVVGMPLCLIGPKLFGKKAYDAAYALKEAQSQLASAVQENMSAQPVIKAFGLQQLFVRRFAARMEGYRAASAGSSFFSFAIDRTTNLGTMLLNLATIAVGSMLAYYGLLSIGSLLAFSTILISLGYLVAAVTWVAPMFIEAVSGMQRIQEILDEEPSVADDESAPRLPPLERGIALRGVTFGYDAKHRSLTDVSLYIPKGSYVAFVGASGSGKSTIVNLLMRLYDPLEGAVFFDDADIRTMNLQSVRSHIGIVFQESFLFHTSIMENIRLGAPDATDEEVIQAAHDAEIHDFIMALPDGYETNVGERGSRLSGGQRQRVAIARAIVRDPDILILDEATSALDPATEAAINLTLRRISANRTVISVTHRLASAEHADCIYVLHRGRIAEQGTHRELMQLADGRYKQSWQKQSGFELSDNGHHVGVHIDRLKLFPLFSELDDGLLKEISRFFVTESYAAGRTLIHEGDIGDKFYVIVHGKVEVLKKDDAGENQAVAVLADGDFFGEVALLRSVPRTATVNTLTPVVCVTLQREFFQSFVQRSPHVAALLNLRSR